MYNSALRVCRKVQEFTELRRVEARGEEGLLILLVTASRARVP